jgi:FCD domain.
MAIPRLSGDDLEEMRRLCGQMRKLAAPGQRREYLNLNRQFHSSPSAGPEATG